MQIKFHMGFHQHFPPEVQPATSSSWPLVSPSPNTAPITASTLVPPLVLSKPQHPSSMPNSHTPALTLPDTPSTGNPVLGAWSYFLCPRRKSPLYWEALLGGSPANLHLGFGGRGPHLSRLFSSVSQRRRLLPYLSNQQLQCVCTCSVPNLGRGFSGKGGWMPLGSPELLVYPLARSLQQGLTEPRPDRRSGQRQ